MPWPRHGGINRRTVGPARNEGSRSGEALRAAAALATYDRRSERWKPVSRWIAVQLLAPAFAGNSSMGGRTAPARDELTPAVAALFREGPTPVAAAILAEYAADQFDVLATALADAPPDSFVVLYSLMERRQPKAIQALTVEFHRLLHKGETPNELAARRQPRYGGAALPGVGDRLSLELEISSDPRCRSYIIDRLARSALRRRHCWTGWRSPTTIFAPPCSGAGPVR